MSFAAVRPYIRARANACKLKEWKDGFNWQNIPRTIVDGSYHMEMGVASGLKQNQTDLEVWYPVTVRIFTKGLKVPAEGIDKSEALATAFVEEALRAKVRLTQPAIKNVVFDTLNVEPFDESNDNLVVATVILRVLVIMNVPNQ